MKKQHLERILKSELDNLNRTIDIKILKGMPYNLEARKHKFLLSRFLQLKKEESRSFFSRLTALPTFFL